MTPEEAVQEYQCPGCVNGPYPDCYKTNENLACDAHCAGTMIAPGIGLIFLGLPKGFNRLGVSGKSKIYLFESPEKGWEYNKFNVPVWRHLDKHGNTLVRGMCPRLNDPWIHIFLGNHMASISCYEITSQDIDEMD